MTPTKLTKLFRLPYLPLWLAPLVLISPVLFTGKAIYWGTPYLQFVPWRVLAWEVIRNGQVPLWNPLNGMGAPLLANYQSALLYPPNWILLTLQAVGGTPAQAWGQALIVYCHWVFAGIGMAVLVKSLGVKRIGQVIAGLAYGLSSYLVTRSSFLSINAAVAWMPWVLYYTNRIAGSENKTDQHFGFTKQVLPLAIVLAFQLLSGHAQTTWYTLVLAGSWLIFWSWQRQGWRSILKSSVKFIQACLFALAISAVQLIPTAEYLLQSQRASAVDFTFATNYSFWPWHLLTLVVPWFFGTPVQGDYWYAAYYWEDAIYIGLLPIVLAITGGIALFRKRKENQFSDATALCWRKLVGFSFALIPCIFLIAMGGNTPVFPFLYKHVITFDMFQAPTRWVIIIVFLLAILAGIGAHLWQRPQNRALYWTRLATAGGVAIMLGAGIAWVFMGEITPTFLKATAIMGFFGVIIGLLSLVNPIEGSRKWLKVAWPWFVAAFLAADLIIVNWGMNPGIASDYYNVTSASANNLTSVPSGQRIFIPPADEDALKYERFFRVNSFQPDAGWDEFKGYVLANSNIYFGIPSANNYDPLVPGRFASWVEHFSTASEALKPALLRWMDVGIVESADPNDPQGIQLNQVQGAQRLHWTSCAILANNDNDAWQKFSQVAGLAGPQPVVLEGVKASDIQPICNPDSVAKLIIIGENTRQLTIATQSTQGGWLIVSDVWYPGWKARVDGVDSIIYRANTLFRAVYVPAGNHVIRMEYLPTSFIIGAGISLAVILAIAAWIFIHSRSMPG